MLIISLTMLYIFIAPYFFDGIISNRFKSRNAYILSVCVVFFILSGFRSLSTGSDTISYNDSYNFIMRENWSEIIGNLLLYVKKGFSLFELNSIRDPGYAVFVKFTQLITTDYRGYLIIISAIFNIPLYFYIKRFSQNPKLSFLIYFALYFSFYGTTGIRQTIAFSLVGLIGTHFIADRKIIPFLLITFLGFLFHKSILIIFPLYFVNNLKIKKGYYPIVISLIVLLFVFRTPYSNLMKSLSGYDEFYAGQYEGAGTWVFSLLYIIILIFSFVGYDTLIKNQNSGILFINSMIIGLFLIPLSFINPSALRVVHYYSFAMLFIAPSLVDVFFNKQDKNVIELAVFILLLFLCLRSGQNYVFM